MLGLRTTARALRSWCNRTLTNSSAVKSDSKTMYFSKKLSFSNINKSCRSQSNLNFCGINKRDYSSTATQEHEEGRDASSPETVQITYIDREGETHVIDGKVGDNVMYLAQRHDLEVEGACEASLACCTCHVYVKDKYYDMLEEPTEEEEDMLDLAPFLQENSRLSCQIILSKEINGIEVQLPSATRNFYVDGHKPKPH
uniref:adrenodoxin-like protein 1, mitochondrial n=1 Tax=Styela clava TaxID=7725 RepID=UPI0019392CAF|nr:adrenodoxin-like protein 1, mitochondrial [Styela clava]